MATRSSVLAWRIPGTGEPGGLPSMGSHRVGHDRSDLAAQAAALCSYESNLIVLFYEKTGCFCLLEGMKWLTKNYFSVSLVHLHI